MSNENPSKPSNHQPPLFDLWERYEEAAKHFNDLNMRWRLQAMGGLVALGTLAGYVVGEQSTIGARLRAMIMLGGLLIAGWLAIAALDLFYYNRLLYGAGQAIRELEDRTTDWPLPIRLSTLLDTKVYWAGKWVTAIFYGLALIPLVAIFVWAVCSYRSLPDSDRALATTTDPLAAANAGATTPL